MPAVFRQRRRAAVFKNKAALPASLRRADITTAGAARRHRPKTLSVKSSASRANAVSSLRLHVLTKSLPRLKPSVLSTRSHIIAERCFPVRFDERIVKLLFPRLVVRGV